MPYFDHFPCPGEIDPCMTHSQMLQKAEYGLERSVASKLSPQQAGKKKSRAATKSREKLNFFTRRPPAQKQREISGWVQRVK